MRNTHQRVAKCLQHAALAVALGLSFAPAASASDITGRDVAVGYADLDAGSIDGATRLLQRIRDAVARVCAPLEHGDLISRKHRLDCEQALTTAAVARVNSQALATVYQSSRRSTPRVMALAK